MFSIGSGLARSHACVLVTRAPATAAARGTAIAVGIGSRAHVLLAFGRGPHGLLASEGGSAAGDPSLLRRTNLLGLEDGAPAVGGENGPNQV